MCTLDSVVRMVKFENNAHEDNAHEIRQFEMPSFHQMYTSATVIVMKYFST